MPLLARGEPMTVPHPPVPVSVRSFRDVTLLEGSGVQFVIATDSVGGIGPKPADSVAVSGATTAHFATRVPLLEVLCAGAAPVVVANALCVERDPLGQEMIEAVRAVAVAAGVPHEGVTGSTEDNVVTSATGIGVTVIGVLGPRGLLCGQGRVGDVVLCLGLPRSAPRHEIYMGHPDLVSVGDVAALIHSGLVHDALPVGSRGVAYELDQLAATPGLEWELLANSGVELDSSGGPSSCVLVACAAADEPTIRAMLPDGLPVAAVATLRCPE